MQTNPEQCVFLKLENKEEILAKWTFNNMSWKMCEMEMK